MQSIRPLLLNQRTIRCHTINNTTHAHMLILDKFQNIWKIWHSVSHSK